MVVRIEPFFIGRASYLGNHAPKAVLFKVCQIQVLNRCRHDALKRAASEVINDNEKSFEGISRMRPITLTMFQCLARKSLAAAKSSSAEISF